MITKLIYPNLCIFCKKVIATDYHLCLDCQTKLIDYFKCPSCNKFIENYICPHCNSEAVIGLFRYDKKARKAIARWKYHGVRKYANSFAKELSYKLDSNLVTSLDALIPVPASKDRLRKRGFNQAYDLSKKLSKIIGVETMDILQRTKRTKAQHSSNVHERAQNIANSIHLINKFDDIFSEDNAAIALVDDIYTSGNTINECIRALRVKYNIKQIYIFVVAIT